MKIYPSSECHNIYLLNTAEKKMLSKNMVDIQKHSGNEAAVDIVISEEGIKSLRERIGKFEPDSDYVNVREVEIQSTNEVAWEHYTAMRDISSLNLKDGNYDIEDVMTSIMDAYETMYNKIVKEHENGGRQVLYELTGKRILTLEEDINGLDEAFKIRLANLEGYITCQQTNKAFEYPDSSWYFHKNDMQNRVIEQVEYNYFDETYRNTAVSIMRQAREEFLGVFNSENYKKGAAVEIIASVLNKNTDFLVKTQKLFH